MGECIYVHTHQAPPDPKKNFIKKWQEYHDSEKCEIFTETFLQKKDDLLIYPENQQHFVFSGTMMVDKSGDRKYVRLVLDPIIRDPPR